MPNNYRINQQNIEPPKKVKKTSVKRERNHEKKAARADPRTCNVP